MEKGRETVGNQSKEEDAGKDKNRNLVERAIDSEPKEPAEKPVDEKMTQVTDGHQQAYARPALVDVLQPKLESQPAPHGGKETVNEKIVSSKESHDKLKGKSQESHDRLKEKPESVKSEEKKLGVEPSAEKVVEVGGVHSAVARNDSRPKNLDLQNTPKERPVEVRHMPQTKEHQAPVPDEKPDLQKTIDMRDKSAKVSCLILYSVHCFP